MNERMPRVGETVLFTPNPDDKVSKSNSNDGAIPAIITRVWGPTTVNLKIFPDCGPVQDRTSVVHVSQNPAGYHYEYSDVVQEKEMLDALSRIDSLTPVIASDEEKFMLSIPAELYEKRLLSFAKFVLKEHHVPSGDEVIDFDSMDFKTDLENWKESIYYPAIN